MTTKRYLPNITAILIENSILNSLVVYYYCQLLFNNVFEITPYSKRELFFVQDLHKVMKMNRLLIVCKQLSVQICKEISQLKGQ